MISSFVQIRFERRHDHPHPAGRLDRQHPAGRELLGSVLFRLLGLQGIGDLWIVGNIIVGVVGAVVLIYAVRLFGKKEFGR